RVPFSGDVAATGATGNRSASSRAYRARSREKTIAAHVASKRRPSGKVAVALLPSFLATWALVRTRPSGPRLTPLPLGSRTHAVCTSLIAARTSSSSTTAPTLLCYDFPLLVTSAGDFLVVGAWSLAFFLVGASFLISPRSTGSPV